MPIGSKLYKNLEELDSKRNYYEDLNKRVTDAVIWYEQTLQKQLAARSASFVGRPPPQPYKDNAYTSAPYSDHGFALPPTPVQPSYGEFYSNRINELSYESHPPIYSAPPLESPSGSHPGAAPSYPPESYGMPPPHNYLQDPYGHQYGGPEYADQGYAPESGYAPYPPQEGYPPQFEAAPYHMGGEVPLGEVASHNGQAPQQNVESVEEKPLIEF